MGWQTVWVPDDIDNRAYIDGLVSFRHAAELLNRPVSHINVFLRDGNTLRTAEAGGRTYIRKSSLDALIRMIGIRSADDALIEDADTADPALRAAAIERRERGDWLLQQTRAIAANADPTRPAPGRQPTIISDELIRNIIDLDGRD